MSQVYILDELFLKQSPRAQMNLGRGQEEQDLLLHEQVKVETQRQPLQPLLLHLDPDRYHFFDWGKTKF